MPGIPKGSLEIGILKAAIFGGLTMNFIKERTKALNENTLEAFKKYCIKVGAPTCVLTSEEAWLRAWRKCQYNDRSCYPKIRKEAKEWLLSHGSTTKIL